VTQQLRTITVDKPGKLLNMNDRGNDYGTGNKMWRDAAYWWAKQHMLRTRGAVGPVEVLTEIGVKDPKRRRDPHNFTKTVKAICDGFTHAAVWVDDSSEYVKTYEPTFTDDIPPHQMRITLTWEDGA
jgi:Holliday junction resolvase RusA-like endonuclease